MTMSAKSTPTLHSVLAFDPGFERLGVAVVRKETGKEKLVHSDCVRTPASLPFPERLAMLGKEAEALIEKFQPDFVALEEVYFEKNAKTAMQVAEVRGVLTYLAAKNGLPVLQYTPLEVKVAITGYGKSDKRAVSMMVERLIALPKKKRLDDELDAIAIALTSLASSRYPHSRGRK
jgi:crossover junction endodeoxyribonuclease RuvC